MRKSALDRRRKNTHRGDRRLDGRHRGANRDTLSMQFGKGSRSRTEGRARTDRRGNVPNVPSVRHVWSGGALVPAAGDETEAPAEFRDGSRLDGSQQKHTRCPRSRNRESCRARTASTGRLWRARRIRSATLGFANRDGWRLVDRAPAPRSTLLL